MVNIDFKDLAIRAAKMADDKKAVDTIVLDVKELTAISDYFLITTAESTPQINAICGDIEKTFKEEGIMPVRREGISSQSWRVIDYGGLVIHVMSAPIRATYKLESFWKDAKTIKIKEVPVMKLSNVEDIKKLAGELKKDVKKKVKKTAKKVAAKSKKTAKKQVKVSKRQTKKAIAKTKSSAKKVVRKAKSTAKKVKATKQTAKRTVRKAKKTIKALGVGFKAFKNALKKPKKKK